jgi:hypothetical protein
MFSTMRSAKAETLRRKKEEDRKGELKSKKDEVG